MQKKINLTNTQRVAISFVLLLLMLFILFISSIKPVYAEVDKDTKFDNTDLLEELNSIPGFNIDDYYFNSKEVVRPKIWNIVEYCYSFRADQRENYGVYIYLHNPSGIEYDINSNRNKVSIAVNYEDIDNAKLPHTYELFNLKFCSKTEDKYNNLFYKFKVVDHVSEDGMRLSDRVDPNARRYAISLINLHEVGRTDVTTYEIGGSWTFSGYSKGYGPDKNAETDLKCVQADDVEYLKLMPVYTYYRTLTSSIPSKHNYEDHQNQLNALYFSVPKQTLKDYGELKRILARWDEYKTSPIFVTNHQEAYEKFKAFEGKDIGRRDDSLKGSITLGRSESGVSVPKTYYDWVYNLNVSCPPAQAIGGTKSYSTLLPYIFKCDGKISEYYLPGKTLTDHIRNYKGPFDNLVIDSVDSGRIRGENLRKFDVDQAGDRFNLLNYKDHNSGWDYFWKYFGHWPDDPTINDIPPIQAVSVEDMSLTNEAISKKYLINIRDVDDFKKYVKDNSKDGITHIFRFANTDYATYETEITLFGDSGTLIDKAGISFLAQQTIFLDIQMLELDFFKNGKYYTIAAVHNPIDGIAGINPPPFFKDDNDPGIPDWIWAIVTILALLLLVTTYPFWSRILKLVFNVLALPFTALASALKGSNKKLSKGSDKKNTSNNRGSPKGKGRSKKAKYGQEEVDLARERLRPKNKDKPTGKGDNTT